MSEDTQLLQEMFYSSLKAMTDRMNKVDDTLERLEDKADKNLVQATRTNGRATALEVWSIEAKLLIEKCIETDSNIAVEIENLKGQHRIDKRTVIVGGTIIAFFLSAFVVLAYRDLYNSLSQNQTNIIKSAVETALDSKINSVKVAP